MNKNQNLTAIKGWNPFAILRKAMIYITDIDLVNDNEYTKFCQFVLKLLSKNQILTRIKGHNSVANLRKTTIYNSDEDLVNNDVYTKFGIILSIRSQDIE